MRKLKVSVFRPRAVRYVGAALVGACALGAAAAPDAARRLAKIASVENTVESRRSGASAWEKAVPDAPLFGSDRIRTGAGSRAAILYADDTLHRLDEKSEIEIVAPEAASTGLLKVLGGRHYFASRKPKDFGRVETPTVTAAIRGTEFAVDVAEGGTTTITMIEGVVLASNAYGSVEVATGERAVAEPGKAPVRSVVVKPRDAVTWAFYYPPVLGGADARRLADAGDEGAALAQASRLLATGQVEAARRIVEDVRGRRPTDPVALSLASVMALVEDRRDEARRLADAAVAADRESPAAVLAASLVAQADFDIERARRLAERAAELDPNDPTVLARAAELRMAEGDLGGAKRAAEAALERAPGDARALTVLGFVELARLHSKEAKALFERAIAADPGLATAHLGLGIATLRRGDLVAGRERIQAAAILDPANSLLRSYLGKAYYEEKRAREAGKELEAAKDLDPSDPTPWLYAAILLQNENRPVEALDHLAASMRRNDNRAVYRSRLLLDEDNAVRAADLARIFNDLGFEQAGLVAARRSADEDQANHSSHLLLSGNYRNLPGYAAAYLSEVLQARVYQPLGVNAARPDVVNTSASFNEYTALFDRPRFRAFGTLGYGTTDTDLSAYDNGVPCGGVPCYTLSENEESRQRQGEIVLTSNGDRYAAALSYRSFVDDGFRKNADEENEVVRGFVQFAASDADTLQINAIHGDRETGDLPLRQILPLITPERFDTSETNVALAWHRSLAPGSDLAASAIWNRTEQEVADLAGTPYGKAILEGPQIEAQWVRRSGTATWIGGVGGFTGDFTLEGAGGSSLEAPDRYLNAYGYARLRGMGPVELTFGASFESVDAPVAMLSPRDSFILPAAINDDASRVSPKLGLTVRFDTGTTIRAGVFRRVAAAIGRVQSLEPTQVAGFNQFFEDPGGTRSWSYGAGFDQAIGSRWYLGASYLIRALDVPQGYCSTPDEFSGCAFQQATHIETRRNDERWGNVYVSGALARWVAASLGYDYERKDLGTTAVTPTGIFQDRIETQRIRPEFRFFTPQGIFVKVSGTHYDQEVDQFDSLSATDRTEVQSSFWVADASFGYRFPKRWGSIALEGRNLFNRKFEFYERSVQERVIPARSIVARLEITY